MNQLQDFFDKELPRINAALQQEMEQLTPLVREVAEHIVMSGGKRLRPMMTILTAGCLGYRKEDIYPLACSLELLHSATLIHDDILDNAHLRRGSSTAHLVFGLQRTVLAGDALLALANMIVARYNIPAMNYSVSLAIMRTATGEVEEIAQVRSPTLEQDKYLEIVKGKTADLIRAACNCGAHLAGAEDRVLDRAGELGLNVGMAFQLVDDALDYASDNGLTGKPLGGDLREGKLTLPLILYLRSLQEQSRQDVLERMVRDDLSEREMQVIISEIQNMGLDKIVREEAGTYLERASEALQVFPENREKILLQEVIEVVRTRQF